MLVVALCGLPAVWSSHWIWIDDQIVVGSQLWPPDSILNESSHAQGRESIVHGVYFKLLSLVFPLQPLWYYLASYVIHICAIGLAAWVVWRATKSGVATTLCALTAGLASTGPEVFLTLLKQELQMTLWIIVALLLLQRLMQPDRFRLGGTLAALAATTFLSGTLGKENFVILPLGLSVGLVCAALTSRRLRLPGRLLAAAISTSMGAAGVFVERYLVGSRSIADGSYTGHLFVFHPTLGAALKRAEIYVFQAGDAMLLVMVAAIAGRRLRSRSDISKACSDACPRCCHHMRGSGDDAGCVRRVFPLIRPGVLFLSSCDSGHGCIDLPVADRGRARRRIGAGALEAVLSFQFNSCPGWYGGPDAADFCVAPIRSERDPRFGMALDDCDRRSASKQSGFAGVSARCGNDRK